MTIPIAKITHPEIRKFVTAAHAAEWRSCWSGSGHIKLYPKDRTQPIVTLSASPSDHRALRNTRADLRRSGLAI